MKRSIHGVVLLILALVLLFIAAPAGAATAKRDCPKQNGDSVSQVAAAPVVYVHGWIGTGADAERDTVPLLEKALNNQSALKSGYRVFAFDYAWANTTWGAEEKISGCLATFVEHLADANIAAGGAGQVAIVAHSMGGIASRAATTYLDQDGRSNSLAGIVTIGTPHQGTPFYGDLATLQENATRAAQQRFGLDPQWSKVATPPNDSPASTCLAFPHPASCAPVPYVQPGQKIASVAGQVKVTVTFFGVPFGNAGVIDAGDSIVPTSSALGYPGSYTGASPRGSYLGEKKVVCQRTSSQINYLALRQGLVDLATVSSYLDEVATGKAGNAMSAWAIVLNFIGAPCNHGALPKSTEALADAADFIHDMHIGALNDPALPASVIPGLPVELSGRWCTRTAPTDCFSDADTKQRYPQVQVSDKSPARDAPGATDFTLCLQMDLGNSCSTASTMFLRYYPAGVGWNCVQEEVVGMHFPGCDPDYTSAHDPSQPRLVRLLNHQQNTDYVDAPPMYLTR